MFEGPGGGVTAAVERICRRPSVGQTNCHDAIDVGQGICCPTLKRAAWYSYRVSVVYWPGTRGLANSKHEQKTTITENVK